jgi:hypothetical protein
MRILPSVRLFAHASALLAAVLLTIGMAPDAARGESPGLKPVWEALRASGLRPGDDPPKSMDLDGDGRTEYIGRAQTARLYDGRRLSAFYIAGRVKDEYKVLYKLIGNFEISEEKLVDFNGDHSMDYFFRYGRGGRDFGYVLVWFQPGSARPVYQRKWPYPFHLEDLDKDGRPEIIQSEGPSPGGITGGERDEWRWMDVYRWDPDKTAFVRDNARYPEFFAERGKMFEALVAQIDAQNVPGLEWTANEKTFLDLRKRIENDYLKRIAAITKTP